MFDDGRVDSDPRWLGPLRELFGADPSTGWMDSTQALEAMAWLGRRVFEQSRVDRGFHTRAGLLAQVQRAASVTNMLTAVQAVRIAQFAATSVAYEPGPWVADADPRDAEDPVAAAALRGGGGAGGYGGEVLHPLGFKAEFADTEVGAALGWGPVQAANRVEDAIDVVTKTPRLLDQMGAGRFDGYRASLVTGELVEAGGYTGERVEDALLAGGVTGWTPGRVRRRTRSLVHRLDPAAERKVRKRRARETIGVFTRPGREAGTTEWNAVLWSQNALLAARAVEDLARALHADTTTGKTLGECRADAMTDLILGNAHVDTQVTLLVPVTRAQTPAAPGDGTAAPDPRDSVVGSDPAGAHPSGPGSRAGWPPQGATDPGAGDRPRPAATRGRAGRLLVSLLEADLAEQLTKVD